MHYHDHEWGVPLHDDRALFEFLILEGAQAGLSWLTVLKKRESYRTAFAHFDVTQVAQFDAAKIAALCSNPNIIRNRLKIESSVCNARQFIELQNKFGSFEHYLWGFVDGQAIQNDWRTLSELPTETALSQKLSRDLKQRGFKFVGPTICYSFMQAVGLINDHLVDCFRYQELKALVK